MPGLLESCGNGGIDYKPFIKNPERQNPDEENQGLSNPCSAQTYVSLKRSTWRSDVLNDMRFLFSVGSSRMRDAYCHLKHISIIQKEFQVHYTALKVHDNQIIQHSNQWHLLLFHFRFDLSGPTGQHCWLQSQCLLSKNDYNEDKDNGAKSITMLRRRNIRIDGQNWPCWLQKQKPDLSLWQLTHSLGILGRQSKAVIRVPAKSIQSSISS